MDEILDQLGAIIGGILGSPPVQFAFQAIGIYFVILWLAAAYWAYRDMQLRTENPLLPYLAASLVILFTPVFFPLAVFVYRIIRPQEKIGEVYERQLAEEALLAEVESVKACPACSRRVDDEWIICPTCRTRLNRVCPNCSRLVGLDWSLCAWCGKDFERHERPAAIQALPTFDETGRLPERAASVAAGGERSTRPAARPTNRVPDPLPER